MTRFFKGAVLFCFFLIVGTALPAQTGKVLFTGKIDNPSKDLIILKKYNDFVYYSLTQIAEIKVGEDGAFTAELSLEFPTPVLMFYGPSQISLFLKPGDSLILKGNTKYFEEGLNFKGKGSEINNYLVQKYLKDPDLKRKLNQASFDLDPENFINFCDSVKNEKLKYLNDFLSDTEVSENSAFLQYEKEEIDDLFLLKKMQYPEYHRFTNNLENFEVKPEYYNFLSRNFLLQRDSCRNFYCPEIAEAIILYRIQQAAEKDQAYVFYPVDSLKADRINALDDTPFSQLLMMRLIRSVILTGNIDLAQKLVAGINWNPEDKILKDRLEKDIQRMSGIQKGKSAPLFTLEDLNNVPVSLSRYRGKPVYLLFWSTYNSESQRELLKAERVFATMPEVVWITISLDRDFNKWKSIMDSRSQKGIHLFGGTEFESLSEDYFLTGLPRGVTIDTKGRIVLNRAPQVADLKFGDFSTE